MARVEEKLAQEIAKRKKEGKQALNDSESKGKKCKK
jgi:hypothetical protein